MRGLVVWKLVIKQICLIVGIYLVANVTTARFGVDGSSMEPMLSNGQNVFISRVSYWLHPPQRGDVIVFQKDTYSQSELIKRIIGLPGETIEIRATRVYINGELLEEPYLIDACSLSACADGIWTIGSDQYFVMGDNRNHSHDSRAFGMIARSSIIGEVFLRY